MKIINCNFVEVVAVVQLMRHTIQKLSYTRVKTTIYNYLGNILFVHTFLVCNASER